MALTPSEEKRVERLLEQALLEGLREGQRRAFQAAIVVAASRVLGREVSDVVGKVAEGGPQGALRLLAGAVGTAYPERWREALEPILTAVMQASTERAAPVLGSFDLANPKMGEFFAGYVSELADNLSATSYENAIGTIREGIDEGLSNPDISRKLQERLPGLNASRADLIARNETHRAGVEASHLQAKESGVPMKGKTWLTAGDSRVRSEHEALDGVTVGLDEAFPNGVQTPGEEIGCRCVLTYEINFDALERLPT